MAARHRIGPARWREAFEVAMGRIAGRFARYEPRLRAGQLVLGLPSSRFTTWPIDSAGPTGDAATRSDHASAITSDKPHPQA
ncbi:hypothetical protein ACWIG3_28530 [Streptomyces celluloflavus]